MRRMAGPVMRRVLWTAASMLQRTRQTLDQMGKRLEGHLPIKPCKHCSHRILRRLQHMNDTRLRSMHSVTTQHLKEYHHQRRYEIRGNYEQHMNYMYYLFRHITDGSSNRRPWQLSATQHKCSHHNLSLLPSHRSVPLFLRTQHLNSLSSDNLLLVCFVYAV